MLMDSVQIGDQVNAANMPAIEANRLPEMHILPHKRCRAVKSWNKSWFCSSGDDLQCV